MSTPDKKSHWASLANVLGAKVPPEPKQPFAAAKTPEPAPAPPVVEETAPVAAVSEPVAPASPPPATAKANPKSKARDNWGKVLGALGLRAPEPEPEPEPVVEVPAPAPVQAILPPANPLPKNLWELLGDKEPEPTIERVETAIFQVEVGGNQLDLGEDTEADDEPPRNGRNSPRAAEPVRAVGEFDRSRRREEEDNSDRPRRRRRRRRRRGEAGVESAETTSPIDDYADSAPSSRHRADEDDEPLDEEFAPPVESYEAEELDAPPARSTEEEGERPRRRRRRRRGRGRGAETQAAAPETEVSRSASYSDEDEGDEEEDFTPAPRREAGRSAAPRGRRVEAPAARESHDADDEDDDVVDHGEHRSIPTWQDAIGLVVSTNMEARAKNPHAGRGGRGRGGRGRGGRGR